LFLLLSNDKASNKLVFHQLFATPTHTHENVIEKTGVDLVSCLQIITSVSLGDKNVKNG
jgi:hypothetical protein